ncbi:MAG: sugar transferase [Phycisphaerae bacterium]
MTTAPTPTLRPFPKAVCPPLTEAELNGRVVRKELMGGWLLNLPRAAWMTLDIFLVSAGMALGHHCFVWWAPAFDPLTDYNLWIAGFILASTVLFSGSVFGLYEPDTLWSRSRIAARCMLTVTLAMSMTWLVMHVFIYSPISRRAAASGIVVFLVTAPVLRLLAHQAVRDVRRGLLVVGQGPLTGTIIRSVRRGSVPGYRLVGVVSSDPAEPPEYGVSDIPVIGTPEEIERICREYEVSEVVVADAAAHDPAQAGAALACLRLGCRVADETTFFESTYGEVPVSHLTPKWFLSADLKGQRQEYAVAKRVFDVAVAGVGLIVTAPLFLVVAALIRSRSEGPVFYSQARIGRGGRSFTLYKFRTMRGDAEIDGSIWAQPDDPRVTKIGRFLRRSRLDELPQLWNILKGEMSVVGPRPERPEFVGPLATLIPYYDERHLVKPGLTGWAQINFPYGATVADAQRKLQLDLYYVKHTSFELDLIILLRTFGTFFQGAR